MDPTSSTPSPDQEISIAAKGGGITFAGKLFEYAGRFVLSIIVARIIGAEQFGLYTLAFTVVTLTSSLALLGLPGSVVRYLPIAIREKDKEQVLGIIQVSAMLPVFLSIILAIFVFFFAEALANQLFAEPSLFAVLRLSSFAIPVVTLISVVASINLGFKKVKYNVYANQLAQQIIKILLTITLLFIGFGVMGVVFAQIAASLIALALLIYFVYTYFPFKFSFRAGQREPGKLLRFSLPIYLGQLVSQLGGSFETLVLGFLGLTAGVGIYSVALRLSVVGNLFFVSIIMISMPIISDLYSQGELLRLEKFYQTTTKWSVTFNIPIFLTFLLFADSLLALFGADFTAGATGLIILSVGSLINAATGICGPMINMTGHQTLTFVNAVVYLTATLLLDILLIPRFGVTGAALAGSLTIMLVNFLRAGEIFVLLKMLPYNKSFLKLIAAGLLAAGLTYAADQFLITYSPLARVGAGMTLLWGSYALLVVLFKLSAEDQILLDSAVKHFKKMLK